MRAGEYVAGAFRRCHLYINMFVCTLVCSSEGDTMLLLCVEVGQRKRDDNRRLDRVRLRPVQLERHDLALAVVA